MARNLKPPPQRAAARRGRPETGQSAGNILDVAERLVQTRGYNGFSYADIAAELGVTKASLHYHFASKADLGRALIERYDAAFAHSLAAIDQRFTLPGDRLRAYVALYESVIRGQRMCLCGMLAAEVSTLPAPMQKQLNAYFDANESWLGQVLAAGRRRGELQFAEPARERARAMIGALEGALLVARVYGDARRFRAAVDPLIRDVCGAPPPMRRRRISPG